MNPFDLPGPSFLAFYAGLGVISFAILMIVRWAASSATGPGSLSDPYEIACLRGGPDEAIRVATCAMIDRGLVKTDGIKLEAIRPDAAYLVGKPLERALMKECSTSRQVDDVMRSPAVAGAARALDEKLRRKGYLAAPSARAGAVLLMVVLIAVSLIKILVALSRGRTNIAYLLMLTVAFVFLLGGLAASRQTWKGLRALADLRSLLKGSRALALGRWRESADLALMAGVFGLAAAATHSASARFQQLFPKSANERGQVTTGGATCGGSWSSSCGSSSSCGGGGCGGGCGGCGGS